MKYLIPAALALLATSAQAQDLVVQLRGPDLAENAGYLLAEAQGLYDKAGVAVTLLAPSSAPPFESLARGQAALAVEWMPTALVARENGLPVVNIGQPFGRPSLRLACRADAGVTGTAQLRGKTVASWFSGTELPLAGWLNRAGVPADTVTLVAQGDGAEMLRQKQADCVSIRSFASAGLAGANLLDPAASDAAMLEDGIYTLDATLADPAMQDRLARFLRASMQGWRAATADPGASARLLLGPDPDDGALQRLTDALAALKDILGDGGLDEAAYLRTSETLRAGGAAAVLKHPPKNAFTRQISDMALSAAPSAVPRQNAASAAQPRP
ncbi:MAG: ABC transporter substrate-binding protein [Paracoccus sp.]|nr:ABC transporter substrate-binding protein [Paracoccus sp. (in: a-proteobacteria)]